GGDVDHAGLPAVVQMREAHGSSVPCDSRHPVRLSELSDLFYGDVHRSHEAAPGPTGSGRFTCPPTPRTPSPSWTGRGATACRRCRGSRQPSWQRLSASEPTFSSADTVSALPRASGGGPTRSTPCTAGGATRWSLASTHCARA